MTVDITDVGYTVIVEEDIQKVTVVTPGAAGALGYYGAFFSDQDQQAAAINTPTAMTLNNTAEANGVSIVSNSQITFAYDGTYDLQFSAQAHHRGGGGNGLEMDVWLKKNGSNLADTATKLVIQKNDYLVPAWDFMLTVEAGDYLELYWQTTNTDIVLEHAAAAGNLPAIPSLIVTVMQVMYNQVGPQGASGAAGSQGPQGASGSQGPQGSAGAAATITAGTTTTLSAGSSATVTNSGTSSAAIFDFGIPAGSQGAQGPQGASVTGPQGSQGPQGSAGTAATITAGTTTTLSAGSSATVTNSGTSSAAVFDFGIPAGVAGSQGPQGASGAQGAQGPQGAQGAASATVLELQVFS